ncbi:hypothetical protein J2W96_006218 [Variovorax guangxiensis]|nr:hypothetical protein [Variovorax guangxiensis]
MRRKATLAKRLKKPTHTNPRTIRKWIVLTLYPKTAKCPSPDNGGKKSFGWLSLTHHILTESICEYAARINAKATMLEPIPKNPKKKTPIARCWRASEPGANLLGSNKPIATKNAVKSSPWNVRYQVIL